MSDREEAEVNSGGNSDTSEQGPPQISLPPPDKREDGEQDVEKPSRYSVDKTYIKPKRWRKYVEAVCAIALVLITFYYARAAYRQARASEIAAHAASDAVCVALRTLRETERSNARQATLSDAARISAQRTAQQSLNSAIAEFNQAQRPWVGMQGFECINCTSEMGKPTRSGETNSTTQTLRISKLVGTIANTGKTPAVGMEINAIATAMPASRGIPTWRSLRAYFKSAIIDSNTIVVLPPNVTHPLTFIDGAEYGREWFVNPSDRRTVYVVGEITYYGTTRKKLHTTTFCLMDVDWFAGSNFKYCPTGNDMN